MRKKKIFITAISFLLSFIMASSNIMVVFAEDAIKNGDDEIKLESELDELIKDDDQVLDSAGFVSEAKQELEEVSDKVEEFLKNDTVTDSEEEHDLEVGETEEKPKVNESKTEEAKIQETKTKVDKNDEYQFEKELEPNKEIRDNGPKIELPSSFYRTLSKVGTFSLTDTIAVDKTAKRSPGCRTFEVTLDITGTPQKAPVDVVLVIDKSGSMNFAAGSYTRLYYAKQAAVNFAGRVLGANGIPGSRVSVVSFSGPTSTWGTGNQNQASTDLNLSTNLTTVTNTINGISAVGGTNTEAGFKQGQAVIQGATSNQNPNSNKVVVMLTDGLPTASNGNRYADTTNINHVHIQSAINAGKYIYQNDIADVFTIGLTTGMNATEKALADNILTQAQNKGYYPAPDSTDLDDIFDEISKSLGYSAQDGVVVDQIKDVFKLQEGSFTELVEGQVSDNPNITYDAETKTITWKPGTIKKNTQLKYNIIAESDFPGGLADTNEYAKLTYKDIFGAAGKTKDFPVPNVNVPTLIKISLTDATIVSGDSISLGTGTDSEGENYMGPVTGGDNDGETFTYEWRKVGDDTVIATDKNPSVSPTEDTEYEVTVKDSNGCKAKAKMWVRVTKKFDIGIKKIADKDTHEELLDGAKFVLKDEDEVKVKSGITVDGYLWMNDLLPGTYTLQETEAPVGYKLNNTEYTVAIAANGDITIDPAITIETKGAKKVLVVENEEQITITANKVWSTGFNEKPTIKFRLYRNGILVEGSVKSLIYPNQILEWEYLDASDDNGIAYEYTVKEVYEDNGKITLEGLEYDVQYSEDFLTVTNTLKNGEVKITKVVTGNSGNLSKEFDIKVTFELPEGKTLLEGHNIEVDSSEVIWNGLTATIKLKHGESLTFSNVPYGVTYTVVESNYEGYEVDYDIQDGDGETKIIDSDKETVLITNNKDVVVNTGISMDSLPYMLILGIVITGTIGWFMKRRKRFDFE